MKKILGVAAVLCVLLGTGAAEAAMSQSVREILDFPNGLILGAAEMIGPATYRSAVSFLNRMDGDMRYFTGGFVYLLVLSGVITPHFFFVKKIGGEE